MLLGITSRHISFPSRSTQHWRRPFLTASVIQRYIPLYFLYYSGPCRETSVLAAVSFCGSSRGALCIDILLERTYNFEQLLKVIIDCSEDYDNENHTLTFTKYRNVLTAPRSMSELLQHSHPSPFGLDQIYSTRYMYTRTDGEKRAAHDIFRF